MWRVAGRGRNHPLRDCDSMALLWRNDDHQATSVPVLQQARRRMPSMRLWRLLLPGRRRGPAGERVTVSREAEGLSSTVESCRQH
jgi:hypothetical protein